ncbi:MAG: IS1595 family transposase [Bacteroidota bacterium]
MKIIKNLLHLTKIFPTEESCHLFLIQRRWGKQPICPRCESDRKVYIMRGGKLLKCAECKKQFTVRVGTIFEDSALPLQKWLFAIFMFASHKKGVSSVQLAKDIGVTQKTAWFMLHRIRYAFGNRQYKMLDGVVEADETYIGGKKRGVGKTGRGTVGKFPVFGMLDRDDGIVVTMPVERVNARTLRGLLKSNVSKDSRLITDEFMSYNGSGAYFKQHDRINHKQQQYVNGDIHTNTLDGFWSLLKRGIIGIYHQVSVDHLHRYCEEFEYRYNSRRVSDTVRFSDVIKNLHGRLMYKTLIGQ